MKILTVCGMGFGTSLMLKMNIDNLCKQNGVSHEVVVSDLGSVKGHVADLIVTSSEMKENLQDNSIPVVYINNLIDAEELKEKVLPLIK